MPRAIAILTAVALFLAAQAPKPVQVDWVRLRGLNYKTGRITDDTKQLDGANVRIVGYIVPLENDDVQKASEFLLVAHNGSCIHVPAPPPNQIVHVKMDGNKAVNIFFGDPVTVQGRMKIATVRSAYGDVAFQMAASSVEKYVDR